MTDNYEPLVRIKNIVSIHPDYTGTYAVYDGGARLPVLFWALVDLSLDGKKAGRAVVALVNDEDNPWLQPIWEGHMPYRGFKGFER